MYVYMYIGTYHLESDQHIAWYFPNQSRGMSVRGRWVQINDVDSIAERHASARKLSFANPKRILQRGIPHFIQSCLSDRTRGDQEQQAVEKCFLLGEQRLPRIPVYTTLSQPWRYFGPEDSSW